LAVLGWLFAPGGPVLGRRAGPAAGHLSVEAALREIPAPPGASGTPPMRSPEGKGAILRLSCPSPAESVLNFYAVEMRARGWRLSRATPTALEVQGAYVLCFRKAGRVCIISVDPKDSWMSSVNVLVL
jgi:hypothetical protein